MASELETSIRKAAEKIGYPVLLKASAGGGGKGMRLVESPDAFDEALKRPAEVRENADALYLLSHSGRRSPG